MNVRIVYSIYARGNVCVYVASKRSNRIDIELSISQHLIEYTFVVILISMRYTGTNAHGRYKAIN